MTSGNTGKGDVKKEVIESNAAEPTNLEGGCWLT